MEQCPIKEMEIKFQCVIDTENSLFEPVPAKKIKPEWYKKLPLTIENYGQDISTIKKCPAMHDWLSMGYLIRNRHSVFVWIGDNNGEPCSLAIPLKDKVTNKDIHKLKSFEDPQDVDTYIQSHDLSIGELKSIEKQMMIAGHPAKQTHGSNWDDKMAFKFKMDFLIETPEGTSCYYLDPFLFDNPYFRVWQGIIDTDKFNQLTTNNMLIFYPIVNESFVISKGTPLVQIVPFIRTPWKMNIEYYSPEELLQMQEDDEEELALMNARKHNSEEKDLQHVYRKKWATRKEYS
tara:strand:- start:579 stop:1448 length:870 start_codon:yes stop_codon:yes gene_type:complete